jgi:hypothetical protein
MNPDLSADRLQGRADDIYAVLLSAHEGLSPEDSAALNARLILILANAVGDADTVMKAVRMAVANRIGA